MKGRIVIAAAVACALAGLGVSYWAFFVRRAGPEIAQPAAPETLRLSLVSGSVEVAGPDGAWRPAAPGTALSSRDRIRTGDDGEAQLTAADGSTVKLLAATDARVAELRRELKRLTLGAGMLEADVRDDPSRVFEVDLDGKGGAARTRGAAFTASSNGAGSAAVATRRGEVILAARGREVVIRTGQYARIAPDAAPDEPKPIPPSLFLKVDWPEGASRKPQVTVAGVTAPGARVRIEGHYLPVDEKGRYTTTVPLSDGTHELHIHAVDVAGHVVDQRSPRILVDTKTDFKVQAPNWR
jgi:ferric-dicitrate binding protein FerR (iron transport regulator)